MIQGSTYKRSTISNYVHCHFEQSEIPAFAGVVFTHLDSFLSKDTYGNAKLAQLKLHHAFVSKAIIDLEKQFNKIYEGRSKDIIYTEAQIFGKLVIRGEIIKIFVPDDLEEEDELHLLIEKHRDIIEYC